MSNTRPARLLSRSARVGVLLALCILALLLSWPALRTTWAVNQGTLALLQRTLPAASDDTTDIADLGQAPTHFERARQSAPDDWRPLVGLAMVQEAAGRPEQALPYWQTVAAQHPTSVVIQYHLGFALLQHGQAEQAFAAWRSIGAEEMFAREAQQLQRNDALADARAFYERALQINPKYRAAQEGWQQTMRQLLVRARQAGDKQEEFALLQELVQVEPQADDYLALARYWLDADDSAEAQRWLEEGVAAFPEASALYHQLGVLQLQNDELEQASQSLTRAVALDPQNLMAYQLLARSLLLQERYQEAEEVLQQGMEQDSEYHWFHARYGDLYASQGDRERARAAYQQALTFAPNFPYAQRRLERLESAP